MLVSRCAIRPPVQLSAVASVRLRMPSISSTTCSSDSPWAEKTNSIISCSHRASTSWTRCSASASVGFAHRKCSWISPCVLRIVVLHVAVCRAVDGRGARVHFALGHDRHAQLSGRDVLLRNHAREPWPHLFGEQRSQLLRRSGQQGDVARLPSYSRLRSTGPARCRCCWAAARLRRSRRPACS